MDVSKMITGIKLRSVVPSIIKVINHEDFYKSKLALSIGLRNELGTSPSRAGVM